MYENLHIYPFWLTEKEDVVAIVGSGEVGTDYYKYSKLFNWNSVDLLDEAFEGYKAGVAVSFFDASKMEKYAKIIITTEKKEDRESVIDKLIASDIPEERIIFNVCDGEKQYLHLLDWYYSKYTMNNWKTSVRCKFVNLPHYVLPLLFQKIGNIKLEYSGEFPELIIYGYTCGARCDYPYFEKNALKIGYWPTEPYLPDFSVLDYAFSGRIVNTKKNIYCRAYWPSIDIQDRKKYTDVKLFDRKFCNFISSNGYRGDGAILRKFFFLKLSEYKHIDSPGKVLNNIQNVIEPFAGSWRYSKLSFISNYKFTIAFENHMLDGYTTEKLFDPLSRGSIPIYWGNPTITKYVNKDCFINCEDYDYDFEKVIRRIIQIDNDLDAYMRMLTTSPMLETYFSEKIMDEEDGWNMIIRSLLKEKS